LRERNPCPLVRNLYWPSGPDPRAPRRQEPQATFDCKSHLRSDHRAQELVTSRASKCLGRALLRTYPGGMGGQKNSTDAVLPAGQLQRHARKIGKFWRSRSVRLEYKRSPRRLVQTRCPSSRTVMLTDKSREKWKKSPRNRAKTAKNRHALNKTSTDSKGFNTMSVRENYSQN
jgi:hypothetical protein